jgi:hypothetical protein
MLSPELLVGCTGHARWRGELTHETVLGLNSQLGARRLARLLLADPLGAEEQWEKELLRADGGSERAVLLKYVYQKSLI